jgi:hypothetical protein
MLQAYVDESGTGDPQYLVIAGFIATSETWAAFSKEWQSRLKAAQLPYFKMNETKNRPEIAGWFYRVIEEHDIKASIACIINTTELRQVEESVIYPPYITNPNSATNPYYWAFKYIVAILAERQHEIGMKDTVNFIFDDASEKTKVLRAWELIKIAARPEISELMGDIPTYRNDRTTLPLQAADLYAWWVLK